MTTDQLTRERSRRKRRAILASGLVLGVGAVVTLAAWNDSVWGDATFGTGDQSWNMQGSVDGGTSWHEFQIQADAGSMQFDLGAIDPGSLTPGDSVHALFGLRETEGHLGSTVTVASPVVDGANTLAQALDVTVYDHGSTNPGACTGTGGTQIVTGKLATVGASTPFTMAAGADNWLCYTVTLPAGTNPSGLAQTVDAAWEMQATSD
ncbi:hypothetical protein G4H71_13400 [Rhodococcus triatomae]|uniref:SipW-cognate class signal peptide n=1 Tax=Rhodococcus triatomae TaxID=300028 RepID=A0A1G8H625_9NOCA|nr:SipW-dependent-type signal peptide-containing protein [Rhodococcus triatomae]QNG20199.1 hypothetical protein G4H72_16980 [Rhodococcus triatomae]QNG23886.1 hypothetical protein G4H71_13400 [Rhodococcus triatomae]SDI01971.1 SipW-cognate class signal peptide [Rhodococcus triatomae]